VFLCYLDFLSFVLLSGLTVITYLMASDRNVNRLILVGLIVLFCSVRIFISSWTQQNIPVPVFVGFAFYFLKLVHYVVEMRNNSFRPHRFLDFFNYMLFFPTVTIGPINRFEDFLKSERRVRWDPQMFAAGLERILYGYVKVIVLANWFVSHMLVSFSLKADPQSGMRVLLDSIIYGFHLYFAFAGYSDIAIGISLLLGYHICENFNHPFTRKNIGEFWQAWHMSLSAWCRQYVFIPVYSMWRRLGLALLASMITIGLWHEFSTRYLLWGIYHGLGLIIWRAYQRYVSPRMPAVEAPVWKRAGQVISVSLTFAFVMIGFTIPRSSSLSELAQNFHRMLGG